MIILLELNHKLGGTFCSQPPLLSAMVHAIYSRTSDMQLVRKSLPALLKEYHFWNSGTIIYIFFDFKWNYVYISSLASFFVVWTFLTIFFSVVVGIHTMKLLHLLNLAGTSALGGWGNNLLLRISLSYKPF